MRPGMRAAERARTSVGSRTATVPTTTRAAPAASTVADRRRVAQPAAHLHGDARPRAQIARDERRPAPAARRARRRGRRRAASARPRASQRRATATGSSP